MLVIVRTVQREDWQDWLRMRSALWPHSPQDDHHQEMEDYLQSAKDVVFVAERQGGDLCGFLEAGMRRFADGCDTSPVGYIEGWYVDPDARRQGVGAQLVRAAEAWAIEQGCREMGSDALLENDASRYAHRALGYREAEVLVHFCKPL